MTAIDDLAALAAYPLRGAAMGVGLAYGVASLPFARVDSVHACPPVSAWIVALAEQRRGVGVDRETHLERASRLREMGWQGKICEQKEGIGR